MFLNYNFNFCLKIVKIYKSRITKKHEFTDVLNLIK